jgi:lipoprotein NlpI
LAYVQEGQYDRAIQDYDRAIKLKSDYAAAFFGRGAAKFYLARFSEAATDLQWGLDLNPSQPYAILWLHLAKKLLEQDDAQDFTQQVARIDPQKWPAPIARLYLGQATPDQVFAAAASRDRQTQKDRRCDAAFYLGENALVREQMSDAVLFLQARDTCPKTSDAYHGAVSELKRLGK